VGKVLVKKGISAQYPVGAGGPIMVMGGGGRSGGGRTKRQRLGGALGGLVGVAGALTGQHRSLGGLTQSMISGGAQGRQLGEAVGRGLSGRSSRASADLKDKRRQAEAERKTLRGEGITRVTAPIDSYNRRVAVRNDEALEQANRSNPMASFAQMTDPNAPKAELNPMTRNVLDINQMLDESVPEMIDLPPVGVKNVATTNFANRVGVDEDRLRQASEQVLVASSNPANRIDPVQAATNAAQANPTQASSMFNSVPQPQNGVGAEATADAGLENTANYGAGAIDDDIDVYQSPQGSSSALPENQVKVMNNRQQIESAKQKVKDREEMME
tara:strand:- start:439 stop:1425 length:987 start_codon:yes stop_codon:yes gene_type:complete